jgi:hypothetical protein
VARTRMSAGRVCVGGIELDAGRSLRLMGSDGKNLQETHPIRPGEIWDLTYTRKANLRPPHVEDVVVTSGKPVELVDDPAALIRTLVQTWRCQLGEIFDGRLEATSNGSAFIRDVVPLPAMSTGFWESTRNVRRTFRDGSTRYFFPDEPRIRNIPYRGMDEPIAKIPAGSLIRFSLARWKELPPGVGEERCYLQLSGWYL